MTCDKCSAAVKAIFHGPGVPDDQAWCEECCLGASVAIPFALLSDGRDLDRPVYERAMAAKKAMSLARLLFRKAEGRWPKRGELRKSED